MVLNYLKLAIRLLIRNPFFAFINVAGLSVGFAVFFILWPFAQSELKSDQFRKDHERIVRLAVNLQWTDNEGGNWEEITGLSPAYTCELVRDAKEIVDITRLLDQSLFDEGNTGLAPEIVVAVGDNTSVLYKEEGVICADQNFFDFFGISFLYGNRKEALSKPESVVLSQSTAIKFFGKLNPIGKLIKMNGIPHEITGVFEDNPHNSHLKFGMAISNAGKLREWNNKATNWKWWPYTYCKLTHPETSITKTLNDRKEKIFDIYHKENPNLRLAFTVQKLDEIVFSENFRHEFFIPKSKLLLILLGVVSLIVLVMAWMNYINFAISQTNSRFKEVAVRKVSGARITDVFLQFICQSALVNLLAAFIGTTMIQLVRQPFSDLFNIRALPVSELDNETIFFFISFFTAGTILTALYPAWAVERLSALQLLGKNKQSQKLMLPSVLTTFQYVAALVLTSWIFIVYFQLDFILKKDIGLSRDHVIFVEAPIVDQHAGRNNELKNFANRVRNIPTVENAALSSWVSGDRTVSQNFFRSMHEDILLIVDTHGVDENFIPLYKIKILAGRNFVKDEHGDGIILSKLFIERLGFKTPMGAIGQWIEILQDSEKWKKVEIIGVIADYRITTFYTAKNYTLNSTDRGQALVYLNNNILPGIGPNRVSIKIVGDRMEESLSRIEKIYKEAFPGNVFSWYFLDDHINQHYNQQKVARNQIFFFTLLAVGVACLGLLSMISNKVVEKTKEIGVRKILGADWPHLVSILLNSTGKQLMISILIGTPVAWKLSQEYVHNFTEQIQLHWWHYALPIVILLVIMFVTIASVLFKAAKTNPVESLRYE